MQKKKKRSGLWSTIILFVVLLAGLCLLLYPVVSNWWNSYHQSIALASYMEKVNNIDTEVEDQMIEAAEKFNENLAITGVHFPLSQQEATQYASLLDIDGTGIMGYIEIPSIKVNMPIYHGTSDTVLQVASGHLEGTSLPVGGENTHCAISGHRGLPSARLFTDLDKLKEGDIFTITILNHKLTYMVDQIRIVLPEEVEDLKIEEGKDYCSLITCTPYSVNTHRLLVRGTRIDNAPDAVVVPPDAVRISSYVVIPIVGIPMLALFLLLTLIVYAIKRPSKSDKQMYVEYKEVREDAKNEK